MTIDLISRAETKLAHHQAALAILKASEDDHEASILELELFLHTARSLAADMTFQPQPTPAAQTGLMAPGSAAPESVESAEAGEAIPSTSPAPIPVVVSHSDDPAGEGRDAALPESHPEAKASEAEPDAVQRPATESDASRLSDGSGTVAADGDTRQSAAIGDHSPETAPAPPKGKPAGEQTPAVPRARTKLTQRVVEAHRLNPNFTAGEIADFLGENRQKVAVICWQKKLPVRKVTPEENSAAHAKAAKVVPQPAQHGVETAAASEAPAKAESPPAPAGDGTGLIKRQLQELHQSSPALDVYGVANRLGVSPNSVRSFSAELGLVWATPSGEPLPPASPVTAAGAQTLTLRQKVATICQQHPTWTPRMIADHLGAARGSVATYLAELRKAAPPPPAPAAFIDEAAIRAETIARRKRLGAPV